MRTLTIVVLLCGIALADKPKLSPADQKTYRELLNKGRQLEDKKKYPDAMAAFDDALKVAPDDATVLAELGWTAYLAKDYDKAEKYTRKALANQATPNIRGAAFYNLGLVQEKKADRAGAITSYTESLKSRWDATVRAALAKLDPAAAAALDPFKPQALAGPFKSIDGYCKTQKNELGDEYTCKCGKDDKPSPLSAAKPYEAFEWVKRRCTIESSEIATTTYGFAAKVGGGWYVGQLAETDEARRCYDDVDTQGMRVESGHPVFRLAEHGGCVGGMLSTDFTEDQIVVVGVGASGKPSATPSIIVTRHEEETEISNDPNAKGKVNVDVKLELSWTKDGIELKGKTKGGDASMVGKHALAFP
jgi:hypothetical protein